MKKLLIIFPCIGFPLFNSLAWGQQTISDLISNAKIPTCELHLCYGLDVFGYFKLDQYDTELKKEMFKKTLQYQEYLTQLKSYKTEMLKTTYYVKVDAEFEDYDVTRRGFNVNLSTNFGIGTLSAHPPKSVSVYCDYSLANDYIFFPALPTTKDYNSSIGGGVYDEYFFIPTDETNGLEVENARSNISIYCFFTPSGLIDVKFKFLNSDENWYDISLNEMKSDKVRIVVANNVSGKIYIDKIYSTLQRSTK